MASSAALLVGINALYSAATASWADDEPAQHLVGPTDRVAHARLGLVEQHVGPELGEEVPDHRLDQVEIDLGAEQDDLAVVADGPVGGRTPVQLGDTAVEIDDSAGGFAPGLHVDPALEDLALGLAQLPGLDLIAGDERLGLGLERLPLRFMIGTRRLGQHGPDFVDHVGPPGYREGGHRCGVSAGVGPMICVEFRREGHVVPRCEQKLPTARQRAPIYRFCPVALPLWQIVVPMTGRQGHTRNFVPLMPKP